ncbi:MAG: DUF3552 domain-containing protein, partial [Candidatus Omnitrophica bacterium]|nr:DUF3552 domain-containing protein [Candidatus Omnitrophota bacterium]
MTRIFGISDVGFAIIGGVFLFACGFFGRKYFSGMKLKNAEEKAKVIVTQAKVEAERKKREA